VIIRIWIEGSEATNGLRARMTCVHDVGQPEEEVYVASSMEEIVGVVRGFVAAFTKGRVTLV
jgi:hypothetical protein